MSDGMNAQRIQELFAGMARVGFLGYGFFGFLWVNPLFINSRIWVFWVFLFFS